MPKLYGSHQKVLFDMIARTNGPILELGSGDFSTAQLHELLEGRKFTTYDNNQEWLNKYIYLQNDFHAFVCTDAKTFYENDTEHWGLVFIDNGVWEDRFDALYKYKDTADYVVIHDSEVMVEELLVNKELKSIVWSDIFKYWKEFHLVDGLPLSPYTLVGSNKFDITNIVIKGMI